MNQSKLESLLFIHKNINLNILFLGFGIISWVELGFEYYRYM
jgi:hypothetical protein